VNRPKVRCIDFRFALLTVGVAAAIAYGSLFPFHYRESGKDLRSLFETARLPLSPAETIANILFYVPFGLAGMAALRRLPAWICVGLVGLTGTVLCICMEWAQSHVASRTPDLWDACANAAGSFLGAFAGAIYRNPSAATIFGHTKRRPFVWLMLTLWLGYQVFPYWIPSSLRTGGVLALVFPLNYLAMIGFFQGCAVWLAVALMIEALVGVARSRIVLPCLSLVILTMPATLFGFVLSPERALGGVVAVLLWSGVVWRLPRRGAIVGALFVSQVILAALKPFHFLSEPGPFHLIPFASFLRDGRDTGAQSFLEKAFTYGALLWVGARAGLRLGQLAFWATALVLALRVAQIYLPGGSAEISDVIITLALAGLMKLLNENPGEAQASGDATNRYPMPRTVTK
jgi:VanZ family protein